jgi:hypothetical protein
VVEVIDVFAFNEIVELYLIKYNSKTNYSLMIFYEIVEFNSIKYNSKTLNSKS